MVDSELKGSLSSFLFEIVLLNKSCNVIFTNILDAIAPESRGGKSGQHRALYHLTGGSMTKVHSHIVRIRKCHRNYTADIKIWPVCG